MSISGYTSLQLFSRWALDMIQILRAKLHGLHVTDSVLDYHGSITLDPEYCHLAGIYPLEFVYVWNKNSGQRLSTYVLYGQAGSRCCILNGAAARTCQKGDELIVCAFEFVARPQEICGRKPTVLIFDADNMLSERLSYNVTAAEDGTFSFWTQSEE
jgi:aspartate 1-decarboxylase